MNNIIEKSIIFFVLGMLAGAVLTYYNRGFIIGFSLLFVMGYCILSIIDNIINFYYYRRIK